MKLGKLTLSAFVFAAIMQSGNVAAAGNGAINGNCFNLQIIGVKAKSALLTDSNRHSIFIPIGGSSKILLQEGEFQVLDGNGTDGAAKFSLPNPDPTNSGTSLYSVFARLVGKPGSGLNMASCAYDATGALFCSQEVLSMKRIAGTSKFVNVSQQLLYIYADINADGVVERIPLFSDSLQDYFWQVDSTGRAHAQLKFCPVSTVVAAP